MKNRFDTPIKWDDLRVFLGAAQAGSLTEAAQRLQMSVATVSRRLENLEDGLGRRLFHRSSHGLSLAPGADELVEHAQRVMDRVFDFLRAAQGGGEALSGTVTVNTIDTVIDRILAPRVAPFRTRYPNIRLVFRAEARVVNLSTRTADIALRIVKPTEERVARQRLAVLRYGVYASVDYLKRRGTPQEPGANLRGHELITYDERLDFMPEARWLLHRCDDGDLAIRMNTVSGILAAVKSGAGIAVLPRLMASADLVCLYSGDDLPSREAWLAVHEDVQKLPRVRAVLDFLKETFKELKLEEETEGEARAGQGVD